MTDHTEAIRRDPTNGINAIEGSREYWEERYPGDVYDTKELTSTFDVKGFVAPFTLVRRKSDGENGTLMFQHTPRFYFNFSPE